MSKYKKIHIFEITLLIFLVILVVVPIYNIFNSAVGRDGCIQDAGGYFEVTSVALPGYHGGDYSYVLSSAEHNLQYRSQEIFHLGDELTFKGASISRYSVDDSYQLSRIAKGICGQISFGSVSVQRPLNQSFLGIFHKFKVDIMLKLGESSPFFAKFFAGLVLGSTQFFAEDELDKYNSISLSHLFAVSGANYILLLSVATKIVGKVNVRLSINLIPVIALIYLFLVGINNLSAMRAGVFIILTWLLERCGVKLSNFKKLLIALIAICIISPGAYLDLGLQLSVCAWLFTKLFISPLLTLLSDLPEMLRDELFSSAFGSLVLLPVTYIFFAQINPLAVTANLIVAPLISIVTVLLIFLIPFINILKYEIEFFMKLLDHFVLLVVDSHLAVGINASIGGLVILCVCTYILYMIFSYYLSFLRSKEIAKYYY